MIQCIKRNKFSIEPSGSALWPDLPCSRTFAVGDYSCMSGALHIRSNDACRRAFEVHEYVCMPAALHLQHPVNAYNSVN